MQVITIPVDFDKVVVEIVSVVVEVATVVDASPAVDVVVTVALLTPHILLFVLLCLVRNVILPDVKFLILPQDMVVDKVVALFAPLVAITLVVLGDGKVVVLSVRATVDFLCVPLIARIGVVRLMEIPIKGVRNATMPKERNSTATNIKNTIVKKDKPKGKNSVRQMLLIKLSRNRRIHGCPLA